MKINLFNFYHHPSLISFRFSILAAVVLLVVGIASDFDCTIDISIADCFVPKAATPILL